jgi:transcriptional regulator with XRE-family HTH domain
MTQEELAKKLGISRTYLNGILRHKRIPSRKLAKRIAGLTDTSWINFRPSDKELIKEFFK